MRRNIWWGMVFVMLALSLSFLLAKPKVRQTEAMETRVSVLETVVMALCEGGAPPCTLTPIIPRTGEARPAYTPTPFPWNMYERTPTVLPAPDVIEHMAYQIQCGDYTLEELKGLLFVQGYDLDVVAQVGETITAYQAEKTKTADTRATRAAVWATLSAE